MKSFIFYSKFIPNFYSCHDFFKFFQAGFGGEPGLIDRTNTINLFSNKNLKTLKPFKFVNESRCLDELCNLRACDIISQEKETFVLWSGGIDSSVALCSLLKNSSLSWQKHNLKIVFNDFTVYENKMFLDFLQKHFESTFIHINYDYILPHLSKLLNGNQIIVTGEMGDQIMGNHFSFVNPDVADKKWNDKDILTIYYKLNKKFKDSGILLEEVDFDNVISVAELLNSKCPFKVENIFDFLTWLNISITWDFNCNRYILPGIPRTNLYNFFDTYEFQNWGICNHERKFKDIKRSEYKKEFKEYMFEFIKESFIYDMKKRTSPGTSSSIDKNNKNVIIAIDDSFKFYFNTKIDKLLCNRFLR